MAKSADQPQSPPDMGYSIGIPVFRTKEDMISWTKSKLTPSRHSEFENRGRQVYVVLDSVGFGSITENIYIFIKNPGSGSWGVLSIWQTYTSAVNVSTSVDGTELIFKAKSGAKLFAVPFEALEPKNDPDF